MPWLVYFDRLWQVKGHLIDKRYAGMLDADLRERYGAEMDFERIREEDEVYFEPGGYGSYYLKQPKMKFFVEGKKLELDCAKVHELMSELSLAERHLLLGLNGEFPVYKSYSRHNVLVLSASEREALLFQLRGAEKEATARWDAFYEKALETRRRIQQEYAERDKHYPILHLEDLEKPPTN